MVMVGTALVCEQWRFRHGTNLVHPNANSLKSKYKGFHSLLKLGPRCSFDEDGEVALKMEKIRKNARRISATIQVEAPLHAVWKVLTDYERLADFIPGLAVSQLVERRENGARLLQIGQKNLAFGLKFEAKGIVDVHENNLEILPFGARRDLDFKMVEGDFQVFEGKWCIEQVFATSTMNEEKRNFFH